MVIDLADYPHFLMIKDIAEILGVGYTKARTVMKYGGLPYIKIGSTYHVSKHQFLQWLNVENQRFIEEN